MGIPGETYRDNRNPLEIDILGIDSRTSFALGSFLQAPSSSVGTCLHWWNIAIGFVVENFPGGGFPSGGQSVCPYSSGSIITRRSLLHISYAFMTLPCLVVPSFHHNHVAQYAILIQGTKIIAPHVPWSIVCYTCARLV